MNFISENCPTLNQFDLELALREVLNNAVKHGNQMNPNKNVSFKIHVDQDWLTIEVSDEGFHLDSAKPQDNRLHSFLENGRGFIILRELGFKVELHTELSLIILKYKRRAAPAV